MSLRTRILRLALGAVLSFAALTAGISVRANASDRFTPNVLQALPQRAQGDFDGDGRVDTAIIQDRAGAGRLSIHLSSSSSAVDLEAAVTGVVEGDIDHDGDLDLVAATASGDLLIWINDGHGRFTRQAASTSRRFSSEPVVVQTVWRDSPAIGVRTPVLPSPVQGEIAVVVDRVRSPGSRPTERVRRATRPPLRAPPVQPV